MKKMKDIHIGFGVTFLVLFIIWVILIGIGASVVVDDVPVSVADSPSQIEAWMHCYQASWAFLAFMLILIALYIPAKDITVSKLAKQKIETAVYHNN